MTLKGAKGAKGRADKLFSEIVRARGACEGPGHWRGQVVIHTRQLQCAHIMSRRFSATRTDEANAFCLCAYCHFYFTAHPVEWTEFVMEKIGRAAYEVLYLKAHTPTKVDWVQETVRLKARKAEVCG